MKTTILSILIYRFNTLSINIPADVLTEMHQLILKLAWEQTSCSSKEQVTGVDSTLPAEITAVSATTQENMDACFSRPSTSGKEGQGSPEDGRRMRRFPRCPSRHLVGCHMAFGSLGRAGQIYTYIHQILSNCTLNVHPVNCT